MVPAVGCNVSPLGNTFGSTNSLTNVSVGTYYFYQTPTEPGPPLNTAYTKARLMGTCRGAGIIELVKDGCTVVVTSVTCAPGVRPWTFASAEFDLPDKDDYNVVVRATAGTVEWSGLKLVLYK